ncbi:MAG TPA: ABC transporter ATP-binding protein [Dehalococcoidia bacterium]|nr:ABC transporter ATP-binding protein [Dehalococcoidia bacterium]
MSTHLRLLTFLLPYKKQVIIAWIAVALTATFTMAIPQLVRFGIDTGLKPPTFIDTGSKIAEPLRADETTMQLTEPADVSVGQKVRIGSENMTIESIDGTTATVERGVEGTRVVAHGKNSDVRRVDRDRFEGSTRTLLIAGSLILAAALLRGVFAYWMTYLSEWLGQHIAFDLRNGIYDRLQRLSYAYHDKQQTGQLMSRATQDVEATRMFIVMGVLRLMQMLLMITVAFVLMAFSQLTLALIAWALLPLIAFQSIRVQGRSRRIWMLIQERLGSLTTILQENLTGVRVVKAFSREKYEEAKFNKEAEKLFDANYSQNKIQSFNNPFYQTVGSLSQVAVLCVGALMITKGNLTAGELTAFIIYLQLLVQPLRVLGFVVQIFARAGAAGERIFEILDAESAVKEKPDAVTLTSVKGAVHFNHVSFSYDAISPVLHDVSFDVEPSQVVALLGPTGSGKTTIVNLLPRFYDVTAGRIMIDEIDIRDTTIASLRSTIGIIQQDVFLFLATIRDNIAYGAIDATQEQIIEAAKIARIHDFIMSLPDGYDTWVGERGITLSGGQKQRISIARTLLLDPKILILDDSTSSVDTQTEFLIQQALAAVMKGRTTLVIAQRLRTVKNADQILVMKDGTIAERGRHEELIAQDGLYREIYDLELRDQDEALRRAGIITEASIEGTAS